MTKLIRIFLPLLVSLFGITSHAREACYDLFLKKVLQAKATKQWLLWENTYNVEQFRRHQVEYNLDTAIVPKAELVSETTENYSIKEKKFVEDVMRLFKTSSGEVVWPFHPMNENQEIDFFSLNRSPKKIKAYAPASR